MFGRCSALQRFHRVLPTTLNLFLSNRSASDFRGRAYSVGLGAMNAKLSRHEANVDLLFEGLQFAGMTQFVQRMETFYVDASRQLSVLNADIVAVNSKLAQRWFGVEEVDAAATGDE